MHGLGLGDGLGASPDLDAPRQPWRPDVVDQGGRLAGTGDVPVLLRGGEAHAADLDDFCLTVEAPTDRGHVRHAVRSDGGDPAEARIALQVREFGIAEDAHACHPSRNIGFSALLGVLLTPWAALSVVVSDASLAWYLFGEIGPVLLLAPFLQGGGMVPGWWRGLPPAGAFTLSIINFLTLTAGGALVSFVPTGWTVVVAAFAGAVNGFLWKYAVRIAVLHQAVRWRRVPVTPIVFAVVVA